MMKTSKKISVKCVAERIAEAAASRLLRKPPQGPLLLLAAALCWAGAPARAAVPDGNNGFYYLPAAETAALATGLEPVPRPVPVQAAGERIFYLTPAQAAPSGFAPPPAPGSAADLADLQEVLRWQKVRTPGQCAAAAAQASEGYEAFFGQVSPFPAPLPAVAAAFFKKVQADSGVADRYLKNLYRRPRPFQRESAVQPCLGKVPGYSYPSGHATAARLMGLILAKIDPAGAARYAAASDQAALNRVIGGVHYPSDVEAGKKLGDLLFSDMLSDPGFAADLDGLRKLVP